MRAEGWTKTSSPPSREIKPKPLLPLNHLTVIVRYLSEFVQGYGGALSPPARHKMRLGQRSSHRAGSAPRKNGLEVGGVGRAVGVAGDELDPFRRGDTKAELH